MTVMTKEEIKAALGVAMREGFSGNEALARTALALHQQLADAKAAQAMVVERAVEIGADIAQRTRPDGFPEEASNAYHSGAMDVVDTIRSLADTDGLALVQALRAERDRLAAANAALEAQVARLVGALDMSRQGWRNALELDLLPKQHRHAAKTMADIADAALAEVQADARREGGE